MHNLRIIRRDVKAESILFLLKLTKERPYRRSSVGTPLWAAPEVYNALPYTTGVDIWSFGATVIEMADGAPCMAHYPLNLVSQLIANTAVPHLKQPMKVSCVQNLRFA